MTETIKLAKTKCGNEVLMRREGKLYVFCPFCGKELLSAWQNVGQDDSNPVRFCRGCDTAWIWQIY